MLYPSECPYSSVVHYIELSLARLLTSLLRTEVLYVCPSVPYSVIRLGCSGSAQVYTVSRKRQGKAFENVHRLLMLSPILFPSNLFPFVH